MQDTTSGEVERILHPVRESRAKLGGMSNSKFYELVGEGKIRTVKIGSRTYLTNSELRRIEAHIEEEGTL